jgi:hypothetical protein
MKVNNATYSVKRIRYDNGDELVKHMLVMYDDGWKLYQSYFKGHWSNHRWYKFKGDRAVAIYYKKLR